MAKYIERISIHAPRGGSDRKDDEVMRDWCISIHAPRGGSDILAVTVFRFL